jgi:hypothetical protein
MTDTKVEPLYHMERIVAPRGAGSRATAALNRLVASQVPLSQPVILGSSAEPAVNPEQGIGIPFGQQPTKG